MELHLEANCCLTSSEPAISSQLPVNCCRHVWALLVYACQSVAPPVLQLIICTVDLTPDGGGTRSETGLDANNVFFPPPSLAPWCTLPCLRDLTRALLLTCSVIWAGHLEKWAIHCQTSLTCSLLQPLLFPHKDSLMPGSWRWHSCCIPPWGSCWDQDEKCLKQRPTLIHRV